MQIIPKWLGILLHSALFRTEPSVLWPTRKIVWYHEHKGLVIEILIRATSWFFPCANRLVCNGAFCVHRSIPPDDWLTAPAHFTMGSAGAALFAKQLTNLYCTYTESSDWKHRSGDRVTCRAALGTGSRCSAVKTQSDSAARMTTCRGEGHRVSAVSKAWACFLAAASH